MGKVINIIQVCDYCGIEDGPYDWVKPSDPHACKACLERELESEKGREQFWTEWDEKEAARTSGDLVEAVRRLAKAMHKKVDK